MPTDTLNVFTSFKEAVAEGVHDFSSDTLRVALCNAANAPVAGDSVLADLTVVSLANLADSSLAVSSSELDGTTYKLKLTDKTLLGSGGTVGPFRYVVVYNDTPAGDPLIGWLDYGVDTQLEDEASLNLNFNETEGVLQLA